MKEEKKTEIEQDKEYIIYCWWYWKIWLSKKTFNNELLEYIKWDYTLDAYREVNKSWWYILKTIWKRKVKLYENENYELYVKKKIKFRFLKWFNIW